ncbi:uncharacterized protein HD556DRAFT_1412126 [Suillus plorans]|uniref:Uncharacterized protein n=1 Tax=Suillus plorans TaxID=116603 RepID=A0A9P7AD13_9AGAM|nr:uncharacterized protein HD556DRAFT_1412126 [Suillus plorans]KAG1786907.1 hypothetical protein HD556DRAFT_1412126 [Suillus plorans]
MLSFHPPPHHALMSFVICFPHYSYLIIVLGSHFARSLHLLDGLPSFVSIILCAMSSPINFLLTSVS